jgi:hypothetical protein
MQLTHRPVTVVALLAALGCLASALLLVRLVAFVAQVAGAGGTAGGTVPPSLRSDGVLLSIGALGAVNLLFLAWYLTPHLVHRVRPLRPLHSAVPPGATAAERERHVRQMPTRRLLASRLGLILVYLSPLLALAALSLPVAERLRLAGASLFDLIGLLCALGGMGYLVWRWLAAPRAA